MLCAVVLAGAIWTPTAHAETADEQIVKIKAAFLFNFVKFIEWPDEAFDGERQPIVIGVLGDRDLAEVVAKTVDGQKVGRRAIAVRALNWPQLDRMDETRRRQAIDAFRAELGGCHMAFIHSDELEHARWLLKEAPHRHTVFVGDGATFAERGMPLALQRSGDRIVLFSNPKAVESLDVRVSSKLLRLAKPVDPET